MAATRPTRNDRAPTDRGTPARADSPGSAPVHGPPRRSPADVHRPHSASGRYRSTTSRRQAQAPTRGQMPFRQDRGDPRCVPAGPSCANPARHLRPKTRRAPATPPPCWHCLAQASPRPSVRQYLGARHLPEPLRAVSSRRQCRRCEPDRRAPLLSVQPHLPAARHVPARQAPAAAPPPASATIAARSGQA